MALLAARARPVAAVELHQVSVAPSAAAATVGHIQALEIHKPASQPILTFGRIQRENGKIATQTAMKSDDMYEYPDEQV